MPQESQEGPVIPQQDRPYLQRWAPFVLKDVQADASKLVNVRVVNLCYETNLQGEGHQRPANQVMPATSACTAHPIVLLRS